MHRDLNCTKKAFYFTKLFGFQIEPINLARIKIQKRNDQLYYTRIGESQRDIKQKGQNQRRFTGTHLPMVTKSLESQRMPREHAKLQR